MIISEKNHQLLLNLFLVLIATTMIFRQPCTKIIISFSIFTLLFYKKLTYSNTIIILISVIAAPLLLEIIFFWNNESRILGWKSLEKSISLLIFPLFILGNLDKILFLQLLKLYSIITTFIVFGFFIRFIVVFPDLINKYMNGIHLWETGYVFSNTIGMHAPALNMHLAFVCICNFYFYIENKNFIKKNPESMVFLVTFLLSFFLVLFINTRMALFCMILGFAIVVIYHFFKSIDFKIHTKKIALIAILSVTIFLVFIKKNTFIKEKYTTQIFSNIDKLGKLDEINHPETVVYSSLVTRLSIWKSAWELSLINLPFGVGSADSKSELTQYFKKTGQNFLTKYEFPTHNQYLDFLLKFGIIGLVVVISYICTIGYLGLRLKNPIIVSFFILFSMSNLTDDFLIRFDGIIFSGFWFTLFAAYFFQQIKQQQFLLNSEIDKPSTIKTF